MKQFLTEGAVISLGKERLFIGYGARRRCRREELNLSLPAFYIPDFFLEDPKPWLQFQNYDLMTTQEFIHFLGEEGGSLQPIEWDNPYRELFRQEFDSLQELFKGSKLSKAVPYVFAEALQPMEIARLKRCLTSAAKSIQSYPGFLYGFWNHEEGMVGVTPELLYRSKGSHLETMALAGTSSKEIPPHLFIQNSKDIREHQMVVEGIQSSLSPFGEVTVGDIQVLELAHLNHLKTSIYLKLNESASNEDIASILHPTPALGAFPKVEGGRWLKAFAEKLPRGRYGAPFGVVQPQQKQTQCLVAIRNIQWDSKWIRIGAGCGVIKESCPEKEWAEIQLKMNAIQRTLALDRGLL